MPTEADWQAIGQVRGLDLARVVGFLALSIVGSTRLARLGDACEAWLLRWPCTQGGPRLCGPG